MSNYNLTKLGLIFLFLGVLFGVITTISMFLTNGKIQALSAIQFIGMIFFLVALIIMVVGGYGLKEYGEKHGKFTLYALIIFLITIGVGVAFLIVTVMMAFSSITGSGDLQGMKSILYFGPVFAILVSIIYIFLLYELQEKYGKIILLVSFIIAIISSIVIVYLSLPIYDDIYGNLNLASSSSREIETLTQEVNIKVSEIGIYNAIHNILLLVVMIIPLNKMFSGDLKPIPRSATSGQKCTNCGFDIPQYSETCPKCGQFYGAQAAQTAPASSLKFCPNCGHKNEEGKTFCEECGVKF